jgi:transposase
MPSITPRRPYPSDITREQFALVEPFLTEGVRKTHPRKYDLYDIFCAVLYIVKTGCQWAHLPHDFPSYQLVFYYYSRWRRRRRGQLSVIDKVFESLRNEARKLANEELNGEFNEEFDITNEERDITTKELDTANEDANEEHKVHNNEAGPSYLIVDTQSVKNTDCARAKGYDAAKKVSGIKRVIAVDRNGIPYAVAIETANVSESRCASNLIINNASGIQGVKKIIVDGGFNAYYLRNTAKEMLNATVEMVKRPRIKGFVVIAKRWVVERTFGWMEKYRRLRKNCERTLYASRQMMMTALVAVLLQRRGEGVNG